MLISLCVLIVSTSVKLLIIIVNILDKMIILVPTFQKKTGANIKWLF